jgi:hypothetical protein
MARKSAIQSVFGKLNPFASKSSPPATQAAATQQQTATISAPPSSGLQVADTSKLNLINHSPEQLMQHVENTLSTVHFGMSKGEKFKEWIGEVWDVIGPMVLLAGTAGEVFAFIWGYSSSPIWWIGASVLATVIVLEATFMVVSYKSSTIRNRAESNPNGSSDVEKKILKRYLAMWAVLALGVAIGQAAFLISAMGAKMSNMVLLSAFAIARTVFTLASDYYTAFVHHKSPTTGEQAKTQLQQRAALARDLLTQKADEVTIINNGIVSLHRVHSNAEIEQDNIRTEQEIKQLENQNRIETLRTQSEQAAMFTRLGNNMMRSLFDPTLPEGDRDRLLGTMQGFMSAMKQLPAPRTTIDEEDI